MIVRVVEHLTRVINMASKDEICDFVVCCECGAVFSRMFAKEAGGWDRICPVCKAVVDTQ